MARDRARANAVEEGVGNSGIQRLRAAFSIQSTRDSFSAATGAEMRRREAACPSGDIRTSVLVSATVDGQMSKHRRKRPRSSRREVSRAAARTAAVGFRAGLGAEPAPRVTAPSRRGKLSRARPSSPGGEKRTPRAESRVPNYAGGGEFLTPYWHRWSGLNDRIAGYQRPRARAAPSGGAEERRSAGRAGRRTAARGRRFRRAGRPCRRLRGEGVPPS